MLELPEACPVQAQDLYVELGLGRASDPGSGFILFWTGLIMAGLSVALLVSPALALQVLILRLLVQNGEAKAVALVAYGAPRPDRVAWSARPCSM